MAKPSLLPYLARALTIGLATGLAVCLTDALLAWLTLGYPVPARLGLVAWYPAAGAAVALTVAAAVRLRRRSAGATELAAATAALLYAPAVVERLTHLLSVRLGTTAGTAVGIVAGLAGIGLWLELMRRLGGTVPGLLLAALAMAVGLALNRNLISLPTEPLALVADGLVVTAAVVLAWTARRAGGGWVVLAVGVAAAAVVGLRAASLGPRFDAAAGSPTAEAPKSAPNLLLVIVDTLRDDVFRAVVDETEEGRSFRRALGDAVWFTNAVAAAPWTPPSVGSILTGLYPEEHGFNRRQGSDSSRPLRRLADSVTTLAEHLRDRGYLTSAIATNPFLQRESGIAQGFLRFESLQDATAKLPLLTALRRAGLIETELYQGAERVRRRLGRQLGSLARSERPFFLWLHLMDPHLPLRRHPDLEPERVTAEIPEIDRLYRDEVRWALRELGDTFELLKSYGLWDDTAAVVVSDHGEMMLSDRRFRGHAWQRKKVRRHGHGHALYRELVRVPLVVRLPAGGRGGGDREVDALTSHVDLPHTLTDLLGVERMPLPGDRVSLEPWLRAPERRRGGRSWALVGATQEAPEQWAVHTGSFKLIDYPGGERPPELYSLNHDPGERRNLAGRRPETVARLRELLADRLQTLLPSPDGEALDVDDELRRRLEALGYL